MARHPHRPALILFAALLPTAAPVRGEQKVFNFQDPKGVNSVMFILDSELEPIMGFATGITGDVSFNPDQPDSLDGTIRIAADQVQCALPAMTKVLHRSDWLNVEEHPTIKFSFRKVKKVKKIKDNEWSLDVEGEIAIKGVVKTLDLEVKASHLAGKAGDRTRGKTGDLLVLRSEFTINRKDHDIKNEMGGAVVAEEIEIRVSIVGHTK